LTFYKENKTYVIAILFFKKKHAIDIRIYRSLLSFFHDAD